jgi:archaeosortase B (VPXXXP-CTERM-specific)
MSDVLGPAAELPPAQSALPEAQSSGIAASIRENRDVLQFCAVFISLTALLNLGYSYYEQSEFMVWYSTLNATLVHDTYKLLGLSVSQARYTVTVNGFSMSIAPVCTAVTTMIIYFACIVAYPAGFLKKIVGILIGFPALALVNFGRLLLLGYLGYTNTELFDLVHQYVFQVVFIVFVIVLWLIWIDKIVRDENKDPVPA